MVHKDGEWWTGRLGDREGIFPSNYVQISEAAPSSGDQESGQLQVPSVAQMLPADTAAKSGSLSRKPGINSYSS